MRGLATALLAALLPGCAVLCGPTVYHLSGITASTTFPIAWDAATAEEGLRALGAQLGMPTECSAQGNVDGRHVEVNGCSPGSTTLRVSFPIDPPAQGGRDDVEAAGDEIIATRTPEAERMLAAFVDATGWNATGALQWHKGLLHGDC